MKILILRFSSIGDIVLTTPVLRCIKSQYPAYSLHYATKAQFAGLLSNNPYISKLHLLDKDLNSMIRELKAENFDIVIDLHRNIRTKLIKTSLRVRSYAFDKLNWEKWLMVMFKINILPYEHIVDRYIDSCKALNVVNDGKGLDYFISPETVSGIKNLPASYLVYAIGAQHNTKKLNLNKKIELLNKVERKTVYLIGGKNDQEEGDELASKCQNAVNLSGQLTIDQSALLMKGAEAVISHDTGMMHIAAALKKPIISVWGNTIPEFGMTPYYGDSGNIKIEGHEVLVVKQESEHVILPHPKVPNLIIEVEELSCRPCSKIGYKQCPRGHFNCMNMQNFDKVGDFLAGKINQ